MERMSCDTAGRMLIRLEWNGWTAYMDVMLIQMVRSGWTGRYGIGRSLLYNWNDDTGGMTIWMKWWYGGTDATNGLFLRMICVYRCTDYTYSHIDTDGQYVWLEGFFYMDGLYYMNGLYYMAVLFLRMEWLYDRLVRIMVGMLWYGYRGTDFGRDCLYVWLDEFFSTARILLYGCHSLMDGRMLQMSWWYVWTYYTAFMVIHM